MKILVVDDSRAIRTYIKGALMEFFDCSVIEAPSGFDALRLLPREEVDCVIADINMPDINGLELVKFIRRGGKHQNTPIVIVSTQQSDESRKRVMDLGANSFIAKPFTPEALKEALDQVLPENKTPDTSKP